jgi:hypothetical protein
MKMTKKIIAIASNVVWHVEKKMKKITAKMTIAKTSGKIHMG